MAAPLPRDPPVTMIRPEGMTKLQRCWDVHPILKASLASVNSTTCYASRLQAPSGVEDPCQNREANGDEQRREPEARADADVPLAIEAPTKAADQIDDGIEQTDRAPERRQHVDRIKGAAEKRERRHHQRRDNGELLEVFRPDANDEA